LSVKLPLGEATKPLAQTVSGKWFEFPKNERGIEAVSFDFSSPTPMLSVRNATGVVKTAIGIGAWRKSDNGFANGLEGFLSVAEHPLVAASGAWSTEDVFNVKLVLYQTPFYSSLNFKFDGDRLLFDAEHNVAFGPTKLPQLVGRVTSTR